jgi:hypothetical protein
MSTSLFFSPGHALAEKSGAVVKNRPRNAARGIKKLFRGLRMLYA